MTRLRCIRCGRDKFTAPSPHRCGGNYRKRGLRWEVVGNEQGEGMRAGPRNSGPSRVVRDSHPIRPRDSCYKNYAVIVTI